MNNKGQVMLLTVLMLGGAILGASTIAGYLMVLKIRASSDITNSTKAIYAADSGIEQELYKVKNPSYVINTSLMTNNSSFTSFNSGGKITSIGKSSGAYRAFEMTYY